MGNDPKKGSKEGRVPCPWPGVNILPAELWQGTGEFVNRCESTCNQEGVELSGQKVYLSCEQSTEDIKSSSVNEAIDAEVTGLLWEHDIGIVVVVVRTFDRLWSGG